MALQITPTRTLACGFLFGAIALLALNHWYFITNDAFYPIVVYAAPVFAFLGLGGLVNPKLLLALEALMGIGCPKLNLQVRADNAEVVAFYESLGYCTEERISMGKRMPE
jgi:hypothetical protein